VKQAVASAALAAVVLGAIIGYGLSSPRSGGAIWVSGLAAMLAGTAALVAVLVLTLVGLRRATERRRAQSAPATHASEQVQASDPVRSSQFSPSITLRNGAAVRRFRDGAADE
jgi:hypothetical protein